MWVGFNIEHKGSGFGSKVNNYMNQLFVAAYGNFSVALVGTPDYQQFLKTWNSFFESTYPVCTSIPWNWGNKPKKGSQGHNFEYQRLLSITERELIVELTKADSNYVEQGKRAIYKAHYKYKDEVKNHIDSALKSYGLPDKYIGVQIRHGDKQESAWENSEVVQTKDYGTAVKDARIKSGSSAIASAQSAAQQILAMRSHNNIRTVWLATIDKDAEAILRKTLGSEYEIKALNASTQEWSGNAAQQYYPGSEFVYDVLTDVEALRRSQVFVGTASSNIGRWVHFLREPGSKSISLDEGFLERAA
jgi:hypothetical protein